MSARDGDHDDDAQLKQLRSVWVSMRDEEPSDRGMAALMAAARTKAAELEQAAQPSWWQRIAATLRRPPVLALATVTVLLGGALIVTQRKDAMKSNAVVETELATPPARTDSLAFGGEDHSAKGPAGAGSAATVASSVAAADPTEAPTAAPAISAPVVGDQLHRGEKDSMNRGEAKLTKSKPTANKMPTATKPAPDSVRDDFSAPPPPALTDSTAPKVPSTGATRPGGGSAPLAIARDSDQPSVEESAGLEAGASVDKPAAKPEPKKPIGRTPPPSIEGEDRQVTTDVKKAQAQQATLDQLVKQCETAAAKGDCPAVRALAQKIFSSSPAAYKTRVANKPAIVRCLPQAADNASSAE